MQISERNDFNRSRLRCFWNPQRARDVVKPYAHLNLRVLAARDLLAQDVGLFKHSADPYYEIHIDDKTYHVSKPVMSDLSPTFDHAPVTVPIWHPETIVMIKLIDYDNPIKRLAGGGETLGFVEFQIKDLPIKGDVLGWFELRLEDMLVGRADTRIAEHRVLRDDMVFDRPEHASVTETKNRQQRGCCGFALKHRGGLRPSAWVPNAGSVLVQLTLDVASPSHEFFAYGLPQPVRKFHTMTILRKKQELPELNVEQLIEHSSFIGDTLWNNGILCIIDSLIYIITWQECCISFVFFTAWVCMGVFPTMALAIFVASIAFWLLILASSKRRARMVANPNTAPLNDEGFALVALLRSTQKMATWVERVIVELLRGVVNNQEDVELFASGIFFDGEPCVQFSQVVQMLKTETHIIDPYASTKSVDTREKKGEWLTVPKSTFLVKNPVTVKQFTRPEAKGVIADVHANDTYTVKLEDGSTLRGVSIGELSYDNVGSTMTKIPMWAIPDAVETSVRDMQPAIGTIREKIGGVRSTIHSILTWKNAKANCCLIWMLLVLSALLFLTGGYLQNVGEYVGMGLWIAVGVVVLCCFSWWCQICCNCCCSFLKFCRNKKKPRHGALKLAYFSSLYDASRGDEAGLLHNTYPQQNQHGKKPTKSWFGSKHNKSQNDQYGQSQYNQLSQSPHGTHPQYGHHPEKTLTLQEQQRSGLYPAVR